MGSPTPFPTTLHRLRARRAAQEATEKNATRVTVPLFGTVTLPPPEQLAYVGGITALVAFEVIEWPVGLALAAGHVLASCSDNKIIQDFGQALESA
jgi:hypothetical protein